MNLDDHTIGESETDGGSYQFLPFLLRMSEMREIERERKEMIYADR